MKLTTFLIIPSLRLRISRHNNNVAFVSSKLPVQHYKSSFAISARGGSSQGSGHEASNIPSLRFIGDKRLMQKQTPVTQEIIQSDEFQNQLITLRLAMKKYGGIGIAAPQIGWWTRVFCFGIEGVNPRYPTASSIPFGYWINPEIIWRSEDTHFMWEGCLSVPDMRGWVERPSEIVLRGMDEQGEVRENRMVGFEARVAQHELDHLDGTLFPMCVPSAGFLVPNASMGARDDWDDNWPSPGSRRTGLGELSTEK